MSSSPLEMTIQRIDEVAIVTLSGDGGFRAADTLASGFLPLLASRPAHVILDLSGLKFISSLEIGQLIAFRRGLAAHGGKVTIARPQERVLSVLKHSQLGAMFEIVMELPPVASA